MNKIQSQESVRTQRSASSSMQRSVQWGSRHELEFRDMDELEEHNQSSSATSTESYSGSSSGSDEEEEVFQMPPVVESSQWDNYNERLRHEVFVDPVSRAPRPSIFLNKFTACVFVTIVEEAINKIGIISSVNKLPQANVNLEYTPLEDKYADFDFQEDRLLLTDATCQQLQFHKFKRDVAYVISVLTLTAADLKINLAFGKLTSALRNFDLIKEQEDQLLKAKKFTQNELVNMRKQLEEEKEEMEDSIRSVTENLGNYRDELNDDIAAYEVKINYVTNWERARDEQNMLTMGMQEQHYLDTMDSCAIKYDRENLISQEIMTFVDEDREDLQKQIENWMNRYDLEMEEKDADILNMKIKLEHLKFELHLAKEKFDTQQKDIDDYKAHKRDLLVQAFILRRQTKAASKIQKWWREVMKRKGLGPYKKRKRKGKGGKKGSAKSTGKKKK